MAFELFGIENENDFYPTAFLSSALEAEIADAISRWASQPGTTSPDKRLEPIAEEYLRLLSRIRQAGIRDVALESAKAALSLIIPALGYDYHRSHAMLDGGIPIPILASVADSDGKDRLWIIEAPLPGKDDEAVDPLSLSFASDQFPETLSEGADTDTAIEDLISMGIFSQDEPPRFILVASPSQLVLVDRNKWASRAVLRFDLVEIFTRADRATLQAVACFISREARVPQTGIPLAERLEEEAQRHANAVTSSLKKTVREAIEILGNEVLSACENKYPKGHPREGVWIESRDLSIECLRYMYRLLFLFYAEANPRLGIMPMKDPAYLSGYSLEALRSLESVRLRTIEDREGTFIWDSLQRLLGLMFEGLEPREIGAKKSFALPRVRVSLLDPKSTPILSRVQLRNEALQKIIRLLSLKQDRAGTGRISYAQLGIGQLGAVYETLISFTGFVAKTDLIELIPGKGSNDSDSEDDEEASSSEGEGDADEEADDEDGEEEEEAYSATDRIDPLAPSYFVERSRASEFTPEQIVYDGTEPRIYRKGSFIYRLAGRDRQKSASYYTPEPLARLLVKHALMERCKDLKADDILELKILEPAMGSAAFLVETTNQLADLYLDRKQQETGRRIPQEDYFEERQRVRAFIADRNCFGVDLNPIAVELGQISLWLNGLHKGDFSPWFGDQLHAGNSLIGARRASYPSRRLKTKKAADLWLNEKPEEIGWRGTRPEGHVWQFLLPAKDMAKFDTEKSIKEFAGPAQDAIKAWRKGGFFAKFEDHEVRLLIQLSEAADALFDAVADDLRDMRERSNDEITIWPDRTMPGVKGQDYQSKLERLRVLQGDEHVSNSLPYQRLKTAMDAWCAMWLWPLDQTDKLPSRHEFLLGLTSILKGGITSSGELSVPGAEDAAPLQANWIERQEAADALAAELPSAAQQSALFQATDIDALIDTLPWLKVAREVAARERFTHYDLIFADVLRERGGFDLIVGNPPWAKPSWNEGVALRDIDPAFVVEKLSAARIRQARSNLLAHSGKRSVFLDMFVSAKGLINVTSSENMNPYASSGQNNLYRCFIDLSFRTLSAKGCAALIHQDGHLSDPKAQEFRKAWYSRVRKHFEFINRITSKNFSEVGPEKRFSINVYCAPGTQVEFQQFTSAFLPSQIEDSFEHDGAGEIPYLTDRSNKWDVRGHKERIISINEETLRAISTLAEDDPNKFLTTKFLQPFSEQTVAVFRKLATSRPLRSVVSNWQMSRLFDETNANRDDAIISRNTHFPSTEDGEFQVLSGPMIYVGNPLSKCPRTGCRSNRDYDVIDLINADFDYISRSNFRISDLHGSKAFPRCKWAPSKSHVNFYRLAFRKMIPINSERSLVSAIIPRDVAHISAIESVSFERELDLIRAAAATSSLAFDFITKVRGRQNLYDNDVGDLPFPTLNDTALERILRLSCLTSHYTDLWAQGGAILKSALGWSSEDARLKYRTLSEFEKPLERSFAFRSEFERRYALVELDVLVAQALGLTLKQLIEIYQTYFPILQKNESGTWFDNAGNIAWTCSVGYPRTGYFERNGKPPSRIKWDDIVATGIDRLSSEARIDTFIDGPRLVQRNFLGPFIRCDRVEDYKRAWAFFEAHKKGDDAA